MLEYTFYFLLIYYFLISIVNIKRRHIKLFLLVFPLVLLIVFRYGIGADYFSYQLLYDTLDISSVGNFLNSHTRTELGFKTLMYAGRLLHIPYHLFNVIICLVILYFITRWIYDNSDDIGISFVVFFSLFFFVWNLSALRQALAMSLALYFLFGKKDLQILHKVAIVLGLSTLHNSALILLLFIPIEHYKLNLKKHLVILTFAMLFTLIPFYRIAVLIPSGIPVVSSLLNYLGTDLNPFFDMQGILRIAMLLPLLLIYNKYSQRDKLSKAHIDSAILGFSIYFIFKFSELAAARLLVYSLILCVVVYANSIYELKESKIKYLGYMYLFAFCSTFFVKEMIALVEQTGLQQTHKFGVPITTVFTSNKEDFNDSYAYLLNQNETHKKEYDTYLRESIVPRVDSIVELTEHREIVMIPVQFPSGHYGLIDDTGRIVRGPNYTYQPRVFDNIIEERFPEHNSVYYTSLNGIILSYEDISHIVMSEISEDMEISSQTLSVSAVDRSYLSDEIMSLFKYKDRVDIYDITTVTKPFEYKVVKLAYFKNYVYVYIDMDGNLILDRYFPDKQYFDKNEILRISNGSNNLIIKRDGTLIWME